MADNTQLVFRMYECFGKGDMDTIRNELFHPEITWIMPGHHPLSLIHISEPTRPY